MTNIDTLIERNAEFASHEFAEIKNLMPALKTLIITCLDARVDPAHLLGLELGDALVVRNIGGRVIPTTFQQIGLLNAVIEVIKADPGKGFTLTVLHHTNCGITTLAGKPALLANYFDIDQADLPAKSVTDPWGSVKSDVETLRNDPTLPANWLVCGLVYDVKTGLVETVVPPTPVHSR